MAIDFISVGVGAVGSLAAFLFQRAVSRLDDMEAKIQEHAEELAVLQDWKQRSDG